MDRTKDALRDYLRRLTVFIGVCCFFVSPPRPKPGDSDQDQSQRRETDGNIVQSAADRRNADNQSGAVPFVGDLPDQLFLMEFRIIDQMNDLTVFLDIDGADRMIDLFPVLPQREDHRRSVVFEKAA